MTVQANSDIVMRMIHQRSPVEQTRWQQVEALLAELCSDTPPTTAQQACSEAIVVQLGLLEADFDMLCAGRLFPFLQFNEQQRLLISSRLSPDVYALLNGVKRMTIMDDLPISGDQTAWTQRQLDHMSAMLLAIVDDVRIVVIKLAERLHKLTLLRTAEPAVQLMLGKKIMALYAPLANRLGLGQLKWQLEDWAFRYIDGDNYRQISKELKQRRQDRELYISKVQDELDHLLRHAELDRYEITGRAKHIYSIFRKIQRKQLSFDKIYDTNAFRILVPSVEDCYHVLSMIHAHWSHIQREFDDYISRPKPNGYQSIHTIVEGPENRYVEIQIRTFDMDTAAELGVAAHWKYKEIGKSDGYENKYHLLREMMEWQLELSEAATEKSRVFSNLFKDRVYVFTPDNHIIDLPAGATPLDVAYHIHTELGHHCRGAKVNQKMVPLTHAMQTGDIIEILTSPEHKPSRDWLNAERGYLKSKTAIAKVKNWFARQFRQEKLEKGQLLWEKMAKREGYHQAQLLQLVEHFEFKSVDDLLVALGSGNISHHALSRQLKPDVIIEPPHNLDLAFQSKHTPDTRSRIVGAEHMLTSLAKCCQPIPGDAIVGYITKGRGVAVHRRNCRNFQQAVKYRPERILEISWGGEHGHRYPVNLKIEAVDHPSLIRDITALVTHYRIPLLGLHSRVDTLTSRAHLAITIEVSSQDDLHNLVVKLQQLPHTLHVDRA